MGLVVLGAIGMVGGVLVACGDDDGGGSPADAAGQVIHVEEATVVAPSGANSAVYLTIRNDGSNDDRLLAVHTSVAASTELHETRADDDGLLRMHPLDHLDLPAGQTVRLEPGGLHLMLFDVDDLAVGSTTDLELVFEHAPPQTVEATVRTHAELIG